jgi:ATPase subunit of ABC transporter with duplicated ATPase domains
MIADITVTEKSFGNKLLYDKLHLTIQAGEKVGLIGRNGVGKSTLLGIMNGTDTDFTGDLQYRHGLVIISTRQEHHGFEHISALEYILGDLPEYAKLKHIMDTYPETMGSNMKLITEYSEALSRFDDLGYYTIEDQIVRELAGFQIGEDKARGELGNLSGGQKRLIEVVKVMHAKAQLALIDEPTNHMDYVAKEQFVTWVKGAREAMLIITHDRDVLRHVDRIVEVKDKHAVSYPGNYDAYLRQNTVNTTTKMHDYEVVQRQVENLKAKVIQFRRLKEKARDPDTIKQFKRRELDAAKELEELQKVEKPSFWIDRESAENLNYKVEANYQKYKAKNIKIHGLKETASKSSRKLIEVRDLILGYKEPLFAPLNFELHEGERTEFRGRNGAGKTTLISALLAMAHGQKPDTLLQGNIKVEPHLSIGVYEQEISEQYFHLGLGAAIERLYYDRGLNITNQKVRQLLSNYLFDPVNDLSVPLSQLSGGQKARFQLIAMLANDPQLLILDEPTNHLDLPSIEEMEAALQKYAGAVIYVSHDDYFRQNLPGDVVSVAP